MENSLLEIGLVHYVVILMWIPLILQVETTTPAWVKRVIIIFSLLHGFLLIANLIQDYNNVYNFSMTCETNCSVAYLWNGAFNDIYYFHTANLF